MSSEPHPVDYYDPLTDEIDVGHYYVDLENWNKTKRSHEPPKTSTKHF